jgi:hypothetical protein
MSLPAPIWELVIRLCMFVLAIAPADGNLPYWNNADDGIEAIYVAAPDDADEVSYDAETKTIRITLKEI